MKQQQQPIKIVYLTLSAAHWERHSAGAWSKGSRWYDQERLALNDLSRPRWKRWLLLRRSTSEPSEVTAYIVFGPARSTLADLVRVAGTRQMVVESLETAKGKVGLDNYKVRSQRRWYRHIILAMQDKALLTVVWAETDAELAPKKGPPYTKSTSSLAAFKARHNLRSA